MRLKHLAVIALLLFALLPYCIVCFYALPFADDFCYGWTASEHIPFIQKFLNQYLKWNGRYTSDVLVQFHPLKQAQLLFYQIPLLLSLLMTPVVIYFFLRQFIKTKTASAVISLAITLFYLAYMPNITEGIYWFIGTANYHIGNLTILLQATLFIYVLQQNGRKYLLLVVSCLLMVVAIGFNEIAALLIPFFYFVAYLFYRQPATNNRQLILIHFIVAFIASVFVIFAPGNFVRTAKFEGHFNIFHSLLYASMQTVRFIGTWSLNYPFIALSVIVLLVGEHIKTEMVDKLNWRLLLFLAVFSLFMGSFVPYFATGMLGQHRTINVVMLWFMMLWFIFLLRLSGRLPFVFVSRQRFVNGATGFLLLSSIIVMVFTGNGRRIYQDYRVGIFDYYKAAFMQRQAGILKMQRPILPLTAAPSTFRIVDAKNDTTWWVDKCMRNYYRDTKTELR